MMKKSNLYKGIVFVFVGICFVLAAVFTESAFDGLLWGFGVGLVADIFADSPYLSTESSYGGEGPSAADRFRKSLSSVSHGVIQSVRDIPRSVWRIALLAIASLALLALLAWGCIKLYLRSSQPRNLRPSRPPNPRENRPMPNRPSARLSVPRARKFPRSTPTNPSRLP